jgi:adenine deaminase
VNGRLVARDGKMVVALPTVEPGPDVMDTVHLSSPLRAEDFVLGAGPDAQSVRLHVLSVGRPRSLETLTFPVLSGAVDLSAHDDVCLVSIIERHGRTSNRSLVPVKGMGLRVGAAATTVSHDSHNLVVAGRNAADMVIAANAVAEVGGGICSVVGGKVEALLPLPIAGLMSVEPVEALVPEALALYDALRRQGLAIAHPIGPLISLALPVIPDYSVTDLGLVDVNAQKVISIWADEVNHG